MVEAPYFSMESVRAFDVDAPDPDDLRRDFHPRHRSRFIRIAAATSYARGNRTGGLAVFRLPVCETRDAISQGHSREPDQLRYER